MSTEIDVRALRGKLVLVALIGVLGCGVPADPEVGPERPDGPGSGPTATGKQRTAPRPEQKGPTVTERGIGGFEVGKVSSGAVERDTGLELSPRPVTDRCSVAWDDDNGVGVVIDDKTLVLVFLVRTGDYRTYGNVGVGSTVDDIVRQFGGAATVLDVTSADGGPLVQVAPPSGARNSNSLGIYFRTGSDRRVTEYRVGFWPWVEYDGYCLPSNTQQTG